MRYLYMGVSWVIGVPPVIIYFSGIVPYKPTILDTPIYGNLHIDMYSLQVEFQPLYLGMTYL